MSLVIRIHFWHKFGNGSEFELNKKDRSKKQHNSLNLLKLQTCPISLMGSFYCLMTKHNLVSLVTDGIDGKQARRTGTSGPLGELFDHGLDSWATLFMPMGMYSVFGRGSFSIPPDRFFFIFLGVMITFSISHWEKYNTGILFLPWGYDISQLVSSQTQFRNIHVKKKT